MRDYAHVALETSGDALIARIFGDVDMSNIGEIARRIEGAIDPGLSQTIVDLSCTEYLDSVGIKFLCRLADGLELRRHRVRIVVPEGSPVGRILRMADVPQLIPMHASVEDAVSASE